MSAIFNACTEFNQSLNNWDVSSVKYMEHTFMDCRVFNQSLNNWNTSAVKNDNLNV
jgi:hypothetical protein